MELATDEGLTEAQRKQAKQALKRWQRETARGVKRIQGK